MYNHNANIPHTRCINSETETHVVINNSTTLWLCQVFHENMRYVTKLSWMDL